ncbi:MAG TPA: hypothetical protein VHO06_19225 [Polyangia bacterium]|nr:hypothetical protein [Polyangia bacterium]
MLAVGSREDLRERLLLPLWVDMSSTVNWPARSTMRLREHHRDAGLDALLDRLMRRNLLRVGLLAGLWGCTSQVSLVQRTDAAASARDASPVTDGSIETRDGQDALACFPLFHACTTSDECCAPNRCLNITGTPACQQEGPAPSGT